MNEEFVRRTWQNIMKRTFALLTLGLVVHAFVAKGFAAETATNAPATTNRINILFLMDDQHRGDWIGAAGAKWMITPNLDRLAELPDRLPVEKFRAWISRAPEKLLAAIEHAAKTSK